MEFNGNSQNEIVKRLSHFLEYDVVTTPSAFAVKAGIDASGFHKMLKGQLKITTATLKKISSTYGLNMTWLLTGEGEMLREKEANHSTSREKNSNINPAHTYRQCRRRELSE